jgi:hypothetical protein
MTYTSATRIRRVPKEFTDYARGLLVHLLHSPEVCWAYEGVEHCSGAGTASDFRLGGVGCAFNWTWVWLLRRRQKDIRA